MPKKQREASKETTRLQADSWQGSTSQQKAQLWTTLLWPARYHSDNSLCSLAWLMIISRLTTNIIANIPHLFSNSLKALKKVHMKKHYDHTQYLLYNILRFWCISFLVHHMYLWATVTKCVYWITLWVWSSRNHFYKKIFYTISKTLCIQDSGLGLWGQSFSLPHLSELHVPMLLYFWCIQLWFICINSSLHVQNWLLVSFQRLH